MKRMVSSQLLFLVPICFSGCILFSTPDDRYPITIDSGDKLEFAVTSSGGPNIWNWWEINGNLVLNDLIYFQGTSKIIFSPSEPGEYTIKCKVKETIVWFMWPFPCEWNCPPPRVQTLRTEERIWKVEVVTVE